MPWPEHCCQPQCKRRSASLRPCWTCLLTSPQQFLSHDGITTFTELIDMQQNVYGVGYDLAVLLAVLGVGLDGDPVTQKLSIGCDATSRTSANGAKSGELGLDGHNKFEGDTSLTRNDYFVGPPPGNNFLFNYTLFQRMSKVCNNNCSRDQLSLYRYQRYQDSLKGNGNFYFGPKSVLLYGASSFLYQLFPSKGDQGKPDQATMNSFFIPEKIPDNWFSRSSPYTIPLVANEIFAQYEEYPVAFGGNTGKPNSFVGIGQNGPYFSNNTFTGTPQGVTCLLYQIATENQPSSLGVYSNVPIDNLRWAASKLNPIYKAAGSPCPCKCP
ncbi:hypothetical protein FH972_026716 [Carpinus fangiana]|uniref:Heme haloperoxidase family profile domain-containing protein n=1 Tax=Carpinus fangiana TaxID=176857 RepID=A0A5N6L564_9ROSI|nr:hypothetical protein FH972_026716 [Carpinus fangiana]